MNRTAWLVMLLSASACAGQPSPGPAAPEPGPAPPGSASAPSTPPVTAAQADTPAASEREALDPEAAELDRAARDSAADMAILEQLAESQPDLAGDSAAEEDPDESSSGGAARDATPVTWDIDVATYNSHDRVQYYLDFFQGPARERMAIWLTRLPRYEPLIRARLKEQGLPGDMVYLALIESGFSNTAVSRSRAVGMWQFMKGTGRLYGLRVDRWVDERRDPIKATDAAVRYLADLRDRFGSPYLAAAAYNAGAGKVGRGLKRLPEEEDDSVNADATFFRLYDTKFLRRETKDYVPKLIAAALIAKEPERYGFVRPEQAAPLAADSIVVSDATGLDVIARLADTTLTAIRELNPQYLRLMTPPGLRLAVRVPAGRGEQVATLYAQLPASQRITFLEHFVSRGETLGQIARQYRLPVGAVSDANPGLRPKALRVGQRLIIPTSGVLPSREVLRSVDDPAPRRSRPGGGMHRVAAGESLWTISQQVGATVAQLRAWNGLGSSNALRVGQPLRVTGESTVPAPARSIAHSASPATPAVHLVRPGETLSALARRYRVSLTALREANGLKGTTVLRAGTALKIPG